MNKMHVFGTHTKVVTDHKPLLPLYNSPSTHKQPRVDRHRTKLFAFDYTRESAGFEELKARLCTAQVLVPYDTHRKTRPYVDSSFVGTQATVAQQHTYQDEEVRRPVNHTSRSWTATKAGYGQVERESNGILTGMYMNKMHVFGTHTKVVTDHKPLLPLYNSPSTPKQPRVDRHRTKLFAFDYTVIYEPEKDTSRDYGSRHPLDQKQFTEEEAEDWCIEADTEVFVNCVVEETLPQAIMKDVLKERHQRRTKKLEP